MESHQQQCKGTLPSQDIHDLIESGVICDADSECVGPASYDVRLSSEIYRVQATFLPLPDEEFDATLHRVNAKEAYITDTLEVGVVYVIRIREELQLPKGISGRMSPKSTTGRHDVRVRLLVPGMSSYDTVPNGYCGPLYVLVAPQSYAIAINQDISLSQLRFFFTQEPVNELEIRELIASNELIASSEESGAAMLRNRLDLTDGQGGIYLTLDMPTGVIGYEARDTGCILALESLESAVVHDFYQPIVAHQGSVMLKAGRFYILSIYEWVRVPIAMACEMGAIDAALGEFRVHDAGFIDPGWGINSTSTEIGNPLTLEVRPHHDMLVSEGQPIARIAYEWLREPTDEPYGSGNANYTSQSAARLAKQFITG